jgi:23S rRNA (adenine2503-C2)-methyltransferase
LAQLLRGRLALVNVIPYNPVAGLPYRSPSRSARERFVEILEQTGINVQVRERKGDEINAACGQLRRLAAPARSGSVSDGLILAASVANASGS